MRGRYVLKASSRRALWAQRQRLVNAFRCRPRSYCLIELASQPPGQRRHEAVRVFFVVEDVGRDAQAAEARRDVDSFAGQSLGETLRHPALEPEAQDMRGSQAGPGHIDADV